MWSRQPAGVQTSIRIRKEGDLSDFERCLLLEPDRLVWAFQKLLIYWDSWPTLGPLVPVEHHLNSAAHLCIVADHVHPFRTTVDHLLMAASSRIMQSSGHLRPVSGTHLIVNIHSSSSFNSSNQASLSTLSFSVSLDSAWVCSPVFQRTEVHGQHRAHLTCSELKMLNQMLMLVLLPSNSRSTGPLCGFFTILFHHLATLPWICIFIWCCGSFHSRL